MNTQKNLFMASEGRDEKGRFTDGKLFRMLVTARPGPEYKFKDGPTLAAMACEYFEWAEKHDKGKYTLAGLRLYLGMSKETWREYKVNPEFAQVISMLDLILEDYFEKKLQWAGSTQGAIFWLKNKAGWRDETTQNQNVSQVVANFGQVVEKPNE